MRTSPADTGRTREVEWRDNQAPIDIRGREALLVELLDALSAADLLDGDTFNRLMRDYQRRGLPRLSKSRLLAAHDALCESGWLVPRPDLRARLQMKPMRTQSGVTVVTVLTKPYPCPGKCIFCPTDTRMPKSYLHDEPGAMRAEQNGFDPYAQTASRLRALERIGHPTEKVELLVLGGTWSSYRRDYQEWFIRRCFDALNGFELPTLEEAQVANASGRRRCVGLVVETRQDHITPDELRWFRRLGVTKVQVGIQSLDEQVLALNRRGHDVQSTRDAFRLLRLAGFKIQGHWMANLLGATVAGDIADFGRLWNDPSIRPDELKIYPCMLVANADLYNDYQRGEYRPYTEEEVLDVLVACKVQVPRWVRLSRVVRDFPTTNVVEGIKRANLREIAQARLREAGTPCRCIRCREVRREQVDPEQLRLNVETYDTDATTEHFLSFDTPDDRLAGFLRLSLPDPAADQPFPELSGCAMIREVHVYGPALNLGDESRGEAQHSGLGARLVAEAKRKARAAGYRKLAVISAVGTREYYARHGFVLDGLYMTAELSHAGDHDDRTH